MKRIRLTGIASWARGGGWRGLLGALVAISLLIEPIRTEQPAAAAGAGIRKWAAGQVVAVRRSHGVDGTGIGIGVLSSGVATLITGEAAGDLPDRVTVLPGQAGEGDEGTATLAILRDLAPGGELYFATGLGGPARFAANLEALCRAGADVIVDDLFDYQETIYQGGLMAQAVRAAVRNGCVYVSARGNPVHSRVREGETAPDRLPPLPDDLSTTGDSAGTSAGLTGTTCVTAANPDFETFCVSTAPPPQVAAMVALTLEAAGGAHNTSLEELRAAVKDGRLGVAPMSPGRATTRCLVSRHPLQVVSGHPLQLVHGRCVNDHRKLHTSGHRELHTSQEPRGGRGRDRHGAPAADRGPRLLAPESSGRTARAVVGWIVLERSAGRRRRSLWPQDKSRSRRAATTPQDLVPGRKTRVPGQLRRGRLVTPVPPLDQPNRAARADR